MAIEYERINENDGAPAKGRYSKMSLVMGFALYSGKKPITMLLFLKWEMNSQITVNS